MRTITVNNRQTFLDLAMQYAGSAEAALAMSVKNDMPLTAELVPGSVLPYPVVVNKTVALLFEVEKIIPCSICYDQPINEGIGYWHITQDFIVQ